MQHSHHAALSEEKRELFEKAPVGRALATMAVPTIISQLINLIYNMVDAFFIGRTGNSYMTAATTLTLTLFLLTIVFSNLFGIGGGSLLILYMVHIAKIYQHTAQGINLLYFIPASAASLVSHVKNKLVCLRAVLWSGLFGVGATVLTSLIAANADTGVLRKLFGGYLIIIGLRELFKKKKEQK